MHTKILASAIDASVDEALPVMVALGLKTEIEEDEETMIDLDAIRWRRYDFNEVKDGPEACSQLTIF